MVGMSPEPGAQLPGTVSQHAVVTRSEKVINSRYDGQLVGTCGCWPKACASALLSRAGAKTSRRIALDCATIAV